MRRRRDVLGAVAAGAVGALAGCSECGETWYAHRLSFDVTDVTETGAGWDLSVTATADFEFPKGEDAGTGRFDVAVYGRDQSLLAYETVDGLRWGDVPEARRTETECGDGGSLSVSTSFSVEELPYYVGPRFLDGAEAASLEPNSTSGFSALRAVRYAGGDAGTATPTNATSDVAAATQTAEPSEAGATTPTDGASAADVSAADYEQVSVEALPWPAPDNQAVHETDALTNVRFRAAPACTSRNEVRTWTFLDADLAVDWARPIPEGSCERPFLASLAFEDGRLTARVGLHEAPQVRCRDCEHLGYSLLVDRRADREFRFEEVELVHLSGNGDAIERVVEPVED